MYKTIIGLEIHTELNTTSKIFSSAKNTYSLDANTNVEPVDIALPGTMPFFNKEVLKKSILLAKIFNMEIADYIMFDRKHYFYCDLPKGYQITQFFKPIGQKGTYKMLNGKTIRIHDIHIEEDTASLDHFDNYTLIDYNRCGIPLIEIVTEPDFEGVDEAISFLEDLRLILKNANLSEADVTKGNIRCDVNISVKKDSDEELGTRVEIKNVNSFSNVRKVIETESKRQIECLEKGIIINQETRRYDKESKTTKLMRSKEDAIDYRYFVEPNIPIFDLSDEFVSSIKNDFILPNDLLDKYTNEYNISLVNAKKIIKSSEMINYFTECINLSLNPVKVTNVLTGVISEYLNKKEISISKYFLKPNDLKILFEKLDNEEISSKQMKEIILNINEEQIDVDSYIKKHNIKLISDEEEITKIIMEVLEENKDKLESYKNGNTNLEKFFFGQIMKKTNGNINPQKANKKLKELLI